jgi:hypothetical protein
MGCSEKHGGTTFCELYGNTLDYHASFPGDAPSPLDHKKEIIQYLKQLAKLLESGMYDAHVEREKA